MGVFFEISSYGKRYSSFRTVFKTRFVQYLKHAYRGLRTATILESLAKEN